MRLKVKDNDKLVIEGWMLDLPFDNFAELALYAFVYGWSKFAGVCFYRREWFAEWLKCETITVEYLVQELCDKGLISKKEIFSDFGQSVALIANRRLGDRDE